MKLSLKGGTTMLDGIYKYGQRHCYYGPDQYDDPAVQAVLKRLEESSAEFQIDLNRGEIHTNLSGGNYYDGTSLDAANGRECEKLIQRIPGLKDVTSSLVTVGFDLAILPEDDDLEDLIETCEWFSENGYLNDETVTKVEEEWLTTALDEFGLDDWTAPATVPGRHYSWETPEARLYNAIHEDDDIWVAHEGYLRNDELEIYLVSNGWVKNDD